MAATYFGGYASYAVAEADKTLPIPAGMDFTTAAAFRAAAERRLDHRWSANEHRQHQLI